ncbi:lipase family protein [Nocardia sp. NPDC051990]|uniref:lipase family protein n=1 Tax=Nocardia sp. NPDC051990 TaxID=3155285 RepID=UPI00343D7588
MLIRFAVATALVAAAAAPAASASADPTLFPAGAVVPDHDPFYTTPADLSGYRNGQPISGREFTARFPTPVRAWQLSYRTTDSHGVPELAVTTVIVPLVPWTGGGPRPVISEQIPEDATGTRCAPSYGIATNTLQSGQQIDPMLAAGWIVAVPDFEGPKSAFLAGPRSGHAVLDGMRAAGQFAPADIGPDAAWALDGYSGGSAATGWAAQLQPSYAPELNIVGAAMGGAPADLPALVDHIDGGPFSGFLFGALVAYRREFPEADIDALLDDRGHADLAAAADSCVLELLARFPFRALADIIGHASYRDTAFGDTLRANSLGAVAPTIPIYDYHSDSDEIVPVGMDDELVDTWRRGGTPIITLRDPIGEHALEATARQSDAQAFLRDRFTGERPVENLDITRPVTGSF